MDPGPTIPLEETNSRTPMRPIQGHPSIRKGGWVSRPFREMNSQSIVNQLQRSGYALLQPAQLGQVLDVPLTDLDALRGTWSRLPQDGYLRDGGHYRFRRHSCFVQDIHDDYLHQVPHRAHWQPTDYNALHGGMQRWFEPIEPEVSSAHAWQALIRGLGLLFAQAARVDQWYIEAHQFRIDTAAGIGRPTPEGAHRDGVDYVAVILIDRHRIRGGETRVFEAKGIAGVRFTMTESWTALLLDDANVIHETTPILPLDDEQGVRDTLVLTYRKNGFQAAAT